MATPSSPDCVTEFQNIERCMNCQLHNYPGEMMLQETNDANFMKVWNIEEETKDKTNNKPMVRLQQAPIYFESPPLQPKTKAVFANHHPLHHDETPIDDETTTLSSPSTTLLNQDASISPLANMEDLGFHLPPMSSISFSSPKALPPSPLSLPSTNKTTRRNGSSNTVILQGVYLDDIGGNKDNDDEELLLKPQRPPKGHRRSGHRRHQSHFDFEFR